MQTTTEQLQLFNLCFKTRNEPMSIITSSNCSFKLLQGSSYSIITQQLPHNHINVPLRTIRPAPSASNTVQMGLIQSKMVLIVRKHPSNLMCRNERFTPEKTRCVQAAGETRVSALHSRLHSCTLVKPQLKSSLPQALVKQLVLFVKPAEVLEVSRPAAACLSLSSLSLSCLSFS